MADPDALRERADALRRLADELHGLVAPSRARAQQPVWQCAHADQVRAALDDQTREARAAADRLHQHARQLDLQAARLLAEREAERARQQAAERERQVPRRA